MLRVWVSVLAAAEEPLFEILHPPFVSTEGLLSLSLMVGQERMAKTTVSV